jgi:hypothetical protein
MQTITTYYLPPTNLRGGRIAARTSSGIRRIYPWTHEVSADANHKDAVRFLLKELNWHERFHAGEMADGSKVWVAAADHPYNCVEI